MALKPVMPKNNKAHTINSFQYSKAIRKPQIVRCLLAFLYIGVPDRGAGRAVAPLGFEKLVKFGQMRWEIRAFRGLNFSR